jgi:hypothetical protein
MSYNPSLSTHAEQRLRAQPEPLRSFVVKSIELLAQNPTFSSQPAKTLSHGQIAEFKFDQVGVSVWVTVAFLYGQDEQTLHIEDIAIEFGA